jgi:hypothetical protein
MSTAKKELIRIVQKQPDTSSPAEIVRALLHVVVQRGLADSDASRALSNDEIGRRIVHGGNKL